MGTEGPGCLPDGPVLGRVGSPAGTAARQLRYAVRAGPEAALSAGDLAEALGARRCGTCHRLCAQCPGGGPAPRGPRSFRSARKGPKTRGHHRRQARGGSEAEGEASARRPEPEGRRAGIRGVTV